MRRKFLSLFASVTLALSFLTVVTVAPVAAACSAFSYGTIDLAEDTAGGGDTLTLGVCSKGLGYNLLNFSHSPAGICFAPVKVVDDWNNCISSISVHFNTSYSFCATFYDGSNYTTPLLTLYELQNSGWTNLSASNDKISSIRFGTWTWSGNTLPSYWYCDFT
jgi:hypothetical protein